MAHVGMTIVFLSISACAGTDTKESTGQYIDSSVLTTKVKTAIFNEPTLKSSEITVQSYKGEVQLSGFVGSQKISNKATEVAQSVPGVTSVKNDLRVKGASTLFFK